MPPTKPLSPWPASITLMVYQLFVALFVSGGRPAHLVYWDATWYRDIATRGYQVQLPLVHEAAGGSSIAFFPAFPLWAGILLHLLPIDPTAAVLLASWTACIGVWAYFICLLRRLGVSAGWSWIAIGAFIVQPGAFYGVAGYSEPLFTAALLGYVHWSTRAVLDTQDRKRWLYFALAVLHGAVLSSTRILGVPCVAYPLLLIFAQAFRSGHLSAFLGEKWREAAAAGALGLLSLGGFAGFLVYCAVRWGQWDIYWEANRVGWNVYFDPWKLLSASYYTDVFFVGNLSEVLGRLLTVATLVWAIALTRSAWKRRSGDPIPLALASLNLGLIAETVVGSHGMHSMIRYLVPIHALLIPHAARLAQDRFDREKNWPGLGLRIACAGLALWLFAIQIMFVIRYSRNEWVS